MATGSVLLATARSPVSDWNVRFFLLQGPVTVSLKMGQVKSGILCGIHFNVT